MTFGDRLRELDREGDRGVQRCPFIDPDGAGLGGAFGEGFAGVKDATFAVTDACLMPGLRFRSRNRRLGSRRRRRF